MEVYLCVYDCNSVLPIHTSDCIPSSSCSPLNFILPPSLSPARALGHLSCFWNDVCCLSRGLRRRCLNTDTYCSTVGKTYHHRQLNPLHTPKTFTLMKLHLPLLPTPHLLCIQMAFFSYTTMGTPRFNRGIGFISKYLYRH